MTKLQLMITLACVIVWLGGNPVIAWVILPPESGALAFVLGAAWGLVCVNVWMFLVDRYDY